MPDSNHSDALAAKHARNRRERLQGVKRWVEYVRTHDPEEWGPQQNRLVDSQLQSATETEHSAEHERRLREFAERAARAADDG
ncbi:MAG: hypothetical protein ABEJ42_01715 [Halobacteriaceae archaeon]